MACWVATSAEEHAASMEKAGPPRSYCCATMAAAMLSRLPAMEKARIGTTFWTRACSSSCACAPSALRPNLPSKSDIARSRAVISSLCSLTLAPTNTPARLRSQGFVS